MSKILCVSEIFFSFNDYRQQVGGWSTSYENHTGFSSFGEKPLFAGQQSVVTACADLVFDAS
jgi:hypothetical protein